MAKALAGYSGQGFSPRGDKGRYVLPPAFRNADGSVAVYFDNAYFELLWLDPDVEVASENEGRAETLRRATDWRTCATSPGRCSCSSSIWSAPRSGRTARPRPTVMSR